MSDPNAQATPDDRDATLVTPRFDEEETVLAQPVVPLDAEETPSAAAAAPTHYAPRPRARRQWPLALALVSALVGGVVGGLGLYLFQQQKRTTPATAEAPAEVTPPAVEQAADGGEASAPVKSAPVTEADAEAEPEDDAPAEHVAERRDDEGDDAARGADRINAPAPPARDTGERESAPKRGKKGERDAELQRRERRTPTDYGPPIAREGGGREARRVDSIVYPSRRAERRAERRARRATRSVDRVRAIFEGQPE